MGRKAKVPKEFLEFKESVEKTGLHVAFSKIDGCKTWCAAVLKPSKYVRHCIWHNNPELRNLELKSFWKSDAWKEYNADKNHQIN